MTRWNLRRRLRDFIFDKLLSFDPGELPTPSADPEQSDAVDVIDDDSPLLTSEAAAMLERAPEKAPIHVAEAVPLTGSVEERLARFKLR